MTQSPASRPKSRLRATVAKGAVPAANPDFSKATETVPSTSILVPHFPTLAYVTERPGFSSTKL